MMNAGDFVSALARGSVGAMTPVREKEAHPQVLVLLLNSFSKATLESSKSVRLSFMVIKTLAAGYSSGNFNKDDKARGTGKPVKREAKDFLYNLLPSGALVAKTYEFIKQGQRGDASDDGACIVPGMVFQMTIFQDDFKRVFGDSPSNMGIFSQCIVYLQSKSTKANATSNGGMLQVFKVEPWNCDIVFGHRLFTETLFPMTVSDSVSRRVGFLDSDKLSEDTGYLVKQDYIHALLSQTRHVLCVKPGPGEADIGRNADGTMYIQLRDSINRLGIDIARVRLHDVGGYMASLGDSNWVENLLRFAMSRKALQVLLTYDSMRQGMTEDDAQIVDGTCFITVSNMLSMCIGEAALEASEVDEELAQALEGGGKGLAEVDVFGDDAGDDGVENGQEISVVVNKTMKKNPVCGSGGAGDSEEMLIWRPAICHPKSAHLWEVGRLIRVYQGSKMVLYFMGSEVAVASVSSLHL